MKAIAKAEQFLTYAKGKRTGVILDLKTYEQLREAEEELAELQAYDSRRKLAHTEVANGHFATLAAYRSGQPNKKK